MYTLTSIYNLLKSGLMLSKLWGLGIKVKKAQQRNRTIPVHFW